MESRGSKRACNRHYVNTNMTGDGWRSSALLHRRILGDDCRSRHVALATGENGIKYWRGKKTKKSRKVSGISILGMSIINFSLDYSFIKIYRSVKVWVMCVFALYVAQLSFSCGKEG